MHKEREIEGREEEGKKLVQYTVIAITVIIRTKKKRGWEDDDTKIIMNYNKSIIVT